MDTPRKRAAIYARLSRDDDASTSIETQVADGKTWCDLRGYDVVLVATDVGVSGSVRPEDREGFRQILDQIHSIDVVVARSIDRYSRTTAHFAALVETLDRHGTVLADVQGQCDLTSPYGRFVVTLMVAFAQLERETIQQRILRSRVELRQRGQWLGGAAPYGYRIVPDGHGGKRLEIDPKSGAILREVIRRVISGVSVAQEVERLNASGILSPSDYRKALRGELPPPAPGYTDWGRFTLAQHLRSEVIRGYRVVGKRSERRVVRDAHGTPIRVGPPLVTDDEWHALQTRLAEHGRTQKRPRRKATLLLHVAYCARCDDDPLYCARRTIDVYTCRAARFRKYRDTCPGVTISARRLEGVVEEWLLRTFGHFPYTERRLVGGGDQRGRADELQSDVEELAMALVGLRGAAKAAVMAQLTARQEALEEALSAPVTPSRWEWVPTGQTVADRWAESDTAARRLILLDMGVRATVEPATSRAWDPGRVTVGIHEDDPAAAALEAVQREETL